MSFVLWMLLVSLCIPKFLPSALATAPPSPNQACDRKGTICFRAISVCNYRSWRRTSVPVKLCNSIWNIGSLTNAQTSSEPIKSFEVPNSLRRPSSPKMLIVIFELLGSGGEACLEFSQANPEGGEDYKAEVSKFNNSFQRINFCNHETGDATVLNSGSGGKLREIQCVCRTLTGKNRMAPQPNKTRKPEPSEPFLARPELVPTVFLLAWSSDASAAAGSPNLSSGTETWTRTVPFCQNCKET